MDFFSKKSVVFGLSAVIVEAYDTGYGEQDRLLASSRNVSILVVDTEVYYNKGRKDKHLKLPLKLRKLEGQSGKPSPKEYLGLMAITYNNGHVASVVVDTKNEHSTKALLEV